MKSFLLILLSALPCVAGIDQERLAKAIYISEGGTHSKSPYGILGVPCHGISDGRMICLRTIRHAERGFVGGDQEFIAHLANIYCPPSVDPAGNRNWRHNVSWLYFKGLVRTRK